MCAATQTKLRDVRAIGQSRGWCHVEVTYSSREETEYTEWHQLLVSDSFRPREM